MDWVERCSRNPQAPVFDILILCDDRDKAHTYLEEEYETQVAATFEGGNQIFRFKDGRFATVWDKPHTVVGALPSLERWNWYGKFNNSPDLACLRERKQVEEIMQVSIN